MKNHSNNSKCHPRLKKEKQNDFIKRIKRNKFDTYFFFVIVKFNSSSIVISVNLFFKEEINVNLRDSNCFVLLQL